MNSICWVDTDSGPYLVAYSLFTKMRHCYKIWRRFQTHGCFSSILPVIPVVSHITNDRLHRNSGILDQVWPSCKVARFGGPYLYTHSTLPLIRPPTVINPRESRMHSSARRSSELQYRYSCISETERNKDEPKIALGSVGRCQLSVFRFVFGSVFWSDLPKDNGVKSHNTPMLIAHASKFGHR